MNLVELIAKKRDGKNLSRAEVDALINGLMAGDLADYQMTAFCMAVFFRGMSDEETVSLTEAMTNSGDVLDLSSVPGLKVDKHSTGGVGDKVSICLAPLVAACGVPVPMVSGRGLGHTGGTLDKLEAIPGFSVTMTPDRFAEVVRTVGTAMIGQTARIAPADKKIYALRDVSATVESIPLIVASILSKKLAEGIDGLVLDVKTGRGAFMKTDADAEKLAEALVRVGSAAGKKVVALLTSMDAPLGLAIGNANETREAFEVLAGRGPADTTECTLALGAEMLVIGGVAANESEARAKLQAAISSGKAIETAEKMVAAHGGDPSVVSEPQRLAVAEVRVSIKAERTGFVAGINALELGLSAVGMGAGRTRADQAVDHGVGIDLCKKPGDAVRAGDELCVATVRKASDAPVSRIAQAFSISDSKSEPFPLVRKRIALPGAS